MTGSATQHTGRTNYNQVYRKIKIMPWEKWFAWYPVKVNGNYTWLKTVYRRCINTYVDMDDWSRYEYGTIFDVIIE
jgi:hypothetical protein